MRRIITAREQAEMLAPWHEAARRNRFNNDFYDGDYPNDDDDDYPDGYCEACEGHEGEPDADQPMWHSATNKWVCPDCWSSPAIGWDPDKKQDPFDPRLLGASRRTAADVARRPTTQDIIDDVRAKHGINLEMENTGGGCYVLEGRLEDGSWVRAADHNDFCWPQLADRHFQEEQEGPLGWDVSFHSNAHEAGQDFWASSNEGADPIHWHSDPGARVEDLSKVIGDAFRTMPPDAKRVQQDKLRESLTQQGLGPGDEEWDMHFPSEGGAGKAAPEQPDYNKLINPKNDLDDDFGDIFGGHS